MINGFMTRAVTLARKDTSIVVAGTVATNLSRLVSTIILTRLLDASAYGVVGILTSIGFAVAMLSDVGIYSFTVRHPRCLEPDFLDKVWTIRLARHFGLAAVLIAIAPAAAWMLDKPIMLPLMVYGLTFAVDGLSSMAFATGPRQRLVGRLALMDAIPTIAALPVAICFALLLKSYWALVIAMIATSLTMVGLSYLLFPNARRKWDFDRGTARELWRFGRAVGGASVIQLILMQADKIVLARLLPLAMFGFYTIASTLIAAVRMFNTTYVKRILFPAFAAAQDLDIASQSAVFYNSGRKVRLLSAFAAGGFLACSPLVITLLYDPRYAPAATFLQLLAISNLFSMTAASAIEMLLAMGHTHQILYLNLARLVSFGIGGTLGLILFGPIGLVAAVAGMEVVGQIYSWWALKKAGIFRIRPEAIGLAAGFAGYLIGAAVNALGMALFG